MAVVVYNTVTRSTTERLSAFPRSTDWNLKIFTGREEALTWLKEEQKKPNTYQGPGRQE